MSPEVIVLGAGVAGSVVARRLKASGLRVALVGSAPRPGWEGVSARSRVLLLEEGLDSSAGLIAGPFERRGTWAGRSVDGQEWLVERSALASALRARALGAGVHGHEGSAIGVAQSQGGWRVALSGGESLHAPLLIDARGRRGAQRRGPLLLAVGQRYRCRPVKAPQTRIEVAGDAWCWWAAVGATLWVQVIAAPRRHHPSTWVAAAAREIPALARLLRGARADGKPCARAAHARLGIASSRSGLWRVGDAAAALDPLSGQGIYQALRSARLTFTAIRSVCDGGDEALAQRFVGERHEETFERGVRVAAEFYRANAAHGEFWAQTATAYEKLLRAPMSDRRGHRIERRAVLSEGRIVERDVLVSAEHPRGVWHVSGVPVADLMRHFGTTAGATVQSASLSLARPPEAVASAMHWLQQSGIQPGG